MHANVLSTPPCACLPAHFLLPIFIRYDTLGDLLCFSPKAIGHPTAAHILTLFLSTGNYLTQSHYPKPSNAETDVKKHMKIVNTTLPRCMQTTLP